MNIGEEIRRARVASGMTQAELAHAVGTSQAAVSVVENGRADLTCGKAVRLLEAVGGTMHVEYDGPETTAVVDRDDLELMQLNLTKTPEARLAGFVNQMQLRGLLR